MINLESEKQLDQTREIPETIKVAYLKSHSKVVVENNKIPVPTGKDVLIKVMAVGVCGSDVHYFQHGRIGKRTVQYPHIQGHEAAGIVVATGDQVTRFKVGDRVAIEPGIACMSCNWCKEGRYNLCPDVQFLSTPPVKGAFAQYLKHPEDFLFAIPETLSYESATLAEPLSVGIHAARRGKLQPGAIVVISGMGPVGLMTVIAAKAFGAKEIIVSDMEPLRLEAAKKLGATRTINIAEESIDEVVQNASSGIGADLVIETSGNIRALQSAGELVKRGGAVVVIGFPATDEVPLNITMMLQKEVDLYSVYRYINTYPLAINLLESLGSEVEFIITDHYSLDEIQEAMTQASTNRSGSLKVMVHPNPAN